MQNIFLSNTNCFIAVHFPFWINILVSVASSHNIATEHATYIQSPVSKPSQFGFSVAAQQTPDFLTLWVGSPKYSVENSKETTAKSGALFRCVSLKKHWSFHNPFSCSIVDFKALEKSDKDNTLVNDKTTANNLTGIALNLNNCTLESELCGFNIGNISEFPWKNSNRSGLILESKMIQKCFGFATKKEKRITGPPEFTINDRYVYANSRGPVLRNKVEESILVSPRIETRRGFVQCLRFCINAYTLIKDAKRSLDVWIEYEQEQSSKKTNIFNFTSPLQNWSMYWNYTEINLRGSHNGFYKIYFKATIYPYHFNNDEFRCKQPADIALSDVTVTNLPCGEEESDVDEITEEQSIGLNLASKTENNSSISLASCGPLYQQNCGYAREAHGICYEMLVNASGVQYLKRHDPLAKECLRGKIDIVLVVDQSGSVNHCNFQKIKRWLRNIVRGINFGENEQDVGVIVYSSAAVEQSCNWNRSTLMLPLFKNKSISSLNNVINVEVNL